MSSQLEQPYVPQQPLVASQNTITGQPQPPSHSHWDGSFGVVFIVLGVIFVVSTIACFLERFCVRKLKVHTGPKQPKQARSAIHHSHPTKEQDVEFGFGKETGHESPKMPKQSS
ncbi:hypothetical protein SAY86_008945 [Trapa natans]|uniref:Transmembrane protein n=1 Tax=Trapa natans TaxID=22666 RepID=A0AAN7KGA2_TRANT|nr:hypothetical protein SAY86_008945 [Trapa natans]